MLQETHAHLLHASAEINSAAREGLYVRMLQPELIILECYTDAAGELHLVLDFRLQYNFEQLDPKRIKEVDRRDEMTQKRSPDFQDPNTPGAT